MNIFRGFRLFQVFLVILASLVFISTFSSKGYGDDWVLVGKDKDTTGYYNSSSVKIDTQKKLIKVSMKEVYTKEGKKDFLNQGGVDKQKYTDINHTLLLCYLDYKNGKFMITHITHYSKSDNVLGDAETPPNWYNMTPGSKSDLLLKKILKDYNIQK